MSLPQDMVLHRDQHGRVSRQKRPEWANDPKNMLSREDVESFKNANLVVPPRMMFEGKILSADIVTRGDGDVIYHFHEVRHPSFRDILAEVVEAHFGNTDSFRFDDAPELPQTYGLLAKGVRNNPLFNIKFYVEDFLWLLDGTMVELRKEK